MTDEIRFRALLDESNGQCAKLEGRTQVIAVLTEKGEIFSSVITEYDSYSGRALIEMLADRDDTGVQRLVCMWSGGTLDLPSFTFRASLLGLNRKNADTEILLQGEKKLIVKTVRASMS